MKRLCLQAKPDPNHSFIVFVSDIIQLRVGPLPPSLFDWLFMLVAACVENVDEQWIEEGARALARSLVTSSDNVDQSYTAALEAPIRMKVIENREKAMEATSWDEAGTVYPFKRSRGLLYVYRRPTARVLPVFAANAAYLCPARVWLLLDRPGWRLELGEDGHVMVRKEVCGGDGDPPCTAQLYLSCLPPLRTLTATEIKLARERAAAGEIWSHFRQLRVRVERSIWGLVEAVVDGEGGRPGIKEEDGRAGTNGSRSADVTRAPP